MNDSNSIRQRNALPKWPLTGPTGAFTMFWIVFAWPWLSGTFTIPWDGKAQFAPQVQFMAASFARGDWPWWTPNVFAGHPQIADPQSMLFSPPFVLLALSDSEAAVTPLLKSEDSLEKSTPCSTVLVTSSVRSLAI